VEEATTILTLGARAYDIGSITPDRRKPNDHFGPSLESSATLI
jgi:hypothetical protein